MQNFYELQGDSANELHDMGNECLIARQVNHLGKTETVFFEWGQFLAAVEALRPRYGSAKNTDRVALAAAAVD